MVIERVGVIVPARDEEDLLPACLDALRVAARRVSTADVHVVVVLDQCIDGSVAVAERYSWVTTVEISAGNVGIARAAGAAEILRWNGAAPLDRLWIATTDADSLVPPDWLTSHLQVASEGWEVVVGTVSVDDWSDHPWEVTRLWEDSYRNEEDHPHIHGANLGFSGAAYLDCGGWAPVAVDEDVALVSALSHRRVLRTARLPVRTSARRNPRAASGFGDTLSRLTG